MLWRPDPDYTAAPGAASPDVAPVPGAAGVTPSNSTSRSSAQASTCRALVSMPSAARRDSSNDAGTTPGSSNQKLVSLDMRSVTRGSSRSARTAAARAWARASSVNTPTETRNSGSSGMAKASLMPASWMARSVRACAAASAEATCTHQPLRTSALTVWRSGLIRMSRSSCSTSIARTSSATGPSRAQAPGVDAMSLDDGADAVAASGAMSRGASLRTQRDQPKYSRFAARSTSTTMRTMPRSVSSPAADGHLGDQRHAAQHELVAGPAGAADARDHRCAGTAGDEHHGPHVQGA